MSEETDNQVLDNNGSALEQNMAEEVHQNNMMASCFKNILDSFSEKQANIFENFATKLVENNNQNMNKFSSDLGQQLVGQIKENMNTNDKNKKNTGVATISVNPEKNKNKKGVASIGVNPNKTSRANARIEDKESSDSSSSSDDSEANASERKKQKRKRVSKGRSQSLKKFKKSSFRNEHQEEDTLSLFGGSDLDENIYKLVDKSSDDSPTDSENDDQEFIKGIAEDLATFEDTGDPISSDFAKIINNAILKPLNREKLITKLEKFPRPENLPSLKVNEEIWCEMLQPRVRSKDVKTQKTQGCVLKAIGAISNIANNLLNLKSNKTLSASDLRKELAPIIHDCTDSIAILSHTNAEIEQNRREDIVGCLDRRYRRLAKNVEPDSEWLFGDDLTKRILNINTNKKLLVGKHKAFSNQTSAYKNSKNYPRFPQNPGNRYQNGYQNKNQTGQFQKNSHFSHNHNNKPRRFKKN